MNWYLRKQDQAVYGPVSLETLTSWAASGRITPDDEVSTDQQKWQPVTRVSALQMEWVLDLGEGERFGPLHVLALAELVRDGSATASQPVQHVTNGTTCSLAEAVLPALLAKPAPTPEPDPELPRLREALAKAEARNAQLENQPPPPDPELPRLREALARAEARIADLINRPPPAPGPEISQLREALAKAESRIVELEAKSRAVENIHLADNTVDAATLLQSFRELSQNYDRLLGKLNDKSAELTGAVEAHARVTKDLEAQLASAHEVAQKDRRDLDDARVRLVELEQTHVEVVRAYRDLNDRYIRLRQQQNESGVVIPTPQPPDKPKVRLV